MAEVPYPLEGAEDLESLKRKLWELIRELYEDKLAGLDIGDVFTESGDVLTLSLTSGGGLEKSNSAVKVKQSDLRLDDFAACQDNTDLNASVSAHGLLPKLGGGTSNYLRADGTWAAPTGNHTQNTDTGTTSNTFAVDSDGNNLVITPGANTFKIQTGTASLDVAAAKTVNIDDDVTVAAELHVEAATHVNQDLTSDAGPTFDHIHLAAGQIGFPATQSASADANTLDDYEENTWTPVVKFGGATTDIAYTTQVGNYTKIGRMVFFQAYITLSSKGSATGTMTLDGLPFTAALGGSSGISIGYIANITFTGQMGAYVQGNSTYISFTETTEAGTATVIANTDFADNSSLIIAGAYYV